MNRMASRLKKLEGVDTAHREVAIIVGSLEREKTDDAFAIFSGGFPLPDLVKSRRETYDEFCARVDVFVARIEELNFLPEEERRKEMKNLFSEIAVENANVA